MESLVELFCAVDDFCQVFASMANIYKLLARFGLFLYANTNIDDTCRGRYEEKTQ